MTTPSSHHLSGIPAADEYAPHFGTYIGLVPEEDLVPALDRQLAESSGFLRGISRDLADHRYAPGKWTVREVIGHVSDTERLFAFRALAFARGEAAPLPGADENAYVENAGFSSVPLEGLVEEYETVRRSTILLFRHLEPQAWRRRGVANKREISVRALGYAILGHERHHARILREKYGIR